MLAAIALLWMVVAGVTDGRKLAPRVAPELAPTVKAIISQLNPHIAGQHPREVFGFIWPPSTNFRRYNWTRLTTVAWLEDPELVCLAHAHNARVVMNAQDVTDVVTSPSKRVAWVVRTVQHILDHVLDGVNFDMEGAMRPGEASSAGYTQLVALTSAVLAHVAPGTQVSVDVPWSPYDVDGRNYDWRGLAAAADLLFIMAYDMQSQVWGRCVAAANTPLPLMGRALAQWVDLGLPRSKLVLGLPWYGYDYPCVADATGSPVPPDVDVCLLEPVPFAGAPCSDAAGGQRTFSDLQQLLRRGANSTAVRRDPLTLAPHFNYLAPDGTTHQVWYDDPESLELRYEVAAAMGLRGVGAWNLEWLYLPEVQDDPAAAAADAQAMWQALDRGFPYSAPAASALNFEGFGHGRL